MNIGLKTLYLNTRSIEKQAVRHNELQLHMLEYCIEIRQSSLGRCVDGLIDHVSDGLSTILIVLK